MGPQAVKRQTRRRKTTKAKPWGVPTPARRGHSSLVDLQEKLRRQASELEEAREERLARRVRID